MTVSDLARERRKEEAVQWFGRLHLATPSAAERDSFERWCAEHPANRETYERTQDIWQDLKELTELPEADALLEETARIAAEPRAVKHRPFKYFAAAGLAAGIVLAVTLLFVYRGTGTQYTTQTGEIRTLNLPDGSRVTLGAHSRLKLEFNEAERRLHLAGGEAFFEVRKDRARPFIVDAGNARVQVLGTKFNVHRGADEVNVAVLEGTVEVTAENSAENNQAAGSRGDNAPTKYVLNEGQQLTAGASVASVHPRPTSDIAPPGAWRNGRFIYESARLSDVIADVNRYYPPGVKLASQDLAGLKVTTAFNVDQIDLMIDSLTRALPLVVQREADGHVVLKPEPSPK